MKMRWYMALGAGALMWACTPILAEEGLEGSEGTPATGWMESAGLNLDLETGGVSGEMLPQQDAEAGSGGSEGMFGLWDGFLTGLEGFEDFPHPVSSPLYFHDPFIETRANILYMWHEFSNGDLKGGDLNVWALQLWVALTERWQLTAKIDGYSKIRARALRPAEGWNDIALGLKYNFYNDVANQFLVSGGMSWRLSNGHSLTLNGGVDELNPFISAAKAFDKLKLIGTFGGRIAMDQNAGNHIVYENLHVSYELWENFYPLLEINGLQYLSDGNRLPLSVGGLDYANIGSNDVAGNSVFWGGVGFRWKIHEHVELGATYEFPISNPDNSIFQQRVTTSIIIGL